MNILDGYEKIASKEGNSELMIRESDSDVYKKGENCYKSYNNSLSLLDIQQYHIFQNWLSRVGVNIPLENNKKGIFPINISGENIDLGFPIKGDTVVKNIVFKPLNLGNNISHDLNNTITKIPYIEGKTLFDISMENFNNEELRINIYNILKELNEIYSGYYMGAPFLLNMVSENKVDKFQVHGINCKITAINNGTLIITITDIARNIQELVKNNQNKIESLMKISK